MNGMDKVRLDPTPPVANLRAMRILIWYEGRLGRLCKFGFSRNDASLYVVGYGPQGRYHFGQHGFAEHERSTTFDASEDGESAEQPPHLSIHESGRVHIRSSSGQAGPLQVPPLSKWTGEHIATVNAVSFSGLAAHDREPKQTGAEQDLVFAMATPTQVSGRLALYINASKPEFAMECKMHFTLWRPTLETPLYVGIAPLNNDRLGAEPGVTVIGGWDPTTALTTTPASFLYVNAK
jgi:hypothetical protein